MPDILRAVLRSIAFLTRLPMPAGVFATGRRLGEDAWAFPLAGIAAALPSCGVLVLGEFLRFSVPTAAIAATIVLVAVTGALHEDGLADVADGLGGHHAKERALVIMKDSRIGSYGTLALILSFFARISLLADLVAVGDGPAVLALLLAAAGSRGAMTWLWSSLPTADPGGLADSVGQPSRRTGLVAAVLGAVLVALGGLFADGFLGAFLPSALAVVATLTFRRFLRRRLGGQTGDTLGAAQQIAEIAILAGFVLAFRTA